MNLGDFHYDPPDYPSRSTFRDSHNNISISAVISSSCVVLEGLRDNSDCLSPVFPLGHDSQTVFASGLHSSVPTSLLAGDVAMLPSITDRLIGNNYLDCPPVGLNYNNHFFESAATEFTTCADGLSSNSGPIHTRGSFLTEDEADAAMNMRPHVDNDFIYNNSEGDIYPTGSIFNREHSLVGGDGLDFCCPQRNIANEMSSNCRFGVSVSNTFHSSNLHFDQSTETCRYAQLSKTSPTYQEDNNASFLDVDEKRVDEYNESTVDYSTNNTCVQEQSHSPSKFHIKTHNYQNDEEDSITTYSKSNPQLKRLDMSPQKNTVCYRPSSNQPKSVLSFSMNTSYSSLSPALEVDGNLCDSLSTNSCSFTDSCREIHLQFPFGNDNKRNTSNTSEAIEEEKYNSDKYFGSALHFQPIRYKQASESDVEFPNKRRCISQDVQNIECFYAERSACEQADEKCVSSPNGLSYSDTGGNSNDVDNRVAELSTKVFSACRSKRKHSETVESLQHHLETLDDRRKKMALSCSSLNLLRQRSQMVEEKSEAEQNVTPIVDVDHMMCSGVTVAGFKPRAIIRKRSKTATPTNVKDSEYWQKRRKNNDSARKSRESKKEKEKNFYRRALELEYENIYLQECLSLAESELASLGHPFVPPVFGNQYYY